MENMNNRFIPMPLSNRNYFKPIGSAHFNKQLAKQVKAIDKHDFIATRDKNNNPVIIKKQRHITK